MRPARALPYRLHVRSRVASGALHLEFANDGAAGAVFSVWSPSSADGPWFYTVGAGLTFQANLPLQPDGYDLEVHGPNGFLRHIRGGQDDGAHAEFRYRRGGGVELKLSAGDRPRRLTVTPGIYRNGLARTHAVQPGAHATDLRTLLASGSWYDFTVTDADDPRWLRRFSGHVETGRPSISDPALGFRKA